MLTEYNPLDSSGWTQTPIAKATDCVNERLEFKPVTAQLCHRACSTMRCKDNDGATVPEHHGTEELLLYRDV
jgi:hypothetical protein